MKPKSRVGSLRRPSRFVLCQEAAEIQVQLLRPTPSLPESWAGRVTGPWTGHSLPLVVCKCCCSPELVFYLVTCSDSSPGSKHNCELTGRNSGAHSGTQWALCGGVSEPAGSSGALLVLLLGPKSLQRHTPTPTGISQATLQKLPQRNASSTLILPVLLTSAVIMGLKSFLSL